MAERHGWRLYTFVLMNNHVHLLGRSPVIRIEHGLWWLHWKYAEHYKAAYRPRLGHVFGRRPKIKPSTDDKYFLTVVRYIALNPVGVAVDHAEEYRWSAHRSIIGKAHSPRCWLPPGYSSGSALGCCRSLRELRHG